MRFPITIGLRRSRFLDGFVALSSLLSGGAVFAFPQSTLIQAATIFIIFLLSALAWRRLTPKISALRLEQSGQISLRYTADQAFALAEMLPGATVHPWLTVVRLKTAEKLSLTLIVTVDSLNAQDFRRLRVFLRWRADLSELNDDA